MKTNKEEIKFIQILINSKTGVLYGLDQFGKIWVRVSWEEKENHYWKRITHFPT